MNPSVQYVIFTEDKQIQKIRSLIDQHLGSATLYFGQGLWNNHPEASLTIVYLGFETCRCEVEELAKAIKELNKQECVYLVSSPITLTVL